MQTVYLILVHANTPQLNRLVKSISSGGNSKIYIHVDLKVSISEFSTLRSIENVYLIKNRVKVRWGAYSMIQCVVNSFKEIIPNHSSDHYLSLISGQDYPLVSNEIMQNFLRENQGKAFMEFQTVYEDWIEAIPRLEKYHFTNYSFPGITKLENLINWILPKRSIPQGINFVGRSQWFTITFEHIAYILEFLDKNKKIINYLKLTWGCDEFVFQTILYNSKHKPSMINNNLRYIDWSEGGTSPKILTIDDAQKLENSGKLFARKFDQNKDEAILNWIDTYLLK